MIKCLLVDDEPDSLNALKQEIALLSSEIEIVAEANSVAAAVLAINATKPDLVLLDIQLGDGSGFDVLEQTEWKSFKVIFVTAYNEYAIKAFKVNAIDYLLKPVISKELQHAIHKVAVHSKAQHTEHIEALMKYMGKQVNQKVSFSTSEGYSLYNIDDIIRCESDNNYSVIYFIKAEKLYVAKTLKDLEDDLSKYGFERVHKSHLINVSHLKKYLNKDGGVILMTDGALIPVSQRKKSDIIELIHAYSL